MMRWCCLLLAALALGACKREVRELRTDPPAAGALNDVAPMANRINGSLPRILVAEGSPYETNAYQLGQGKRLYDWFNCKGCHANGGGASGPALSDGWWRYGPDPVSIFLSIRDGRPHGMPGFSTRLTTEQIWQLTGYVRTIGAYAAKTAAPSRNDEMQSRPAENRAPAATNLRMPPSR
jgi:cytochrome c oxidase cbb3-type subunit III